MFSLIIPFHSDSERIQKTLELIIPSMSRHNIAEIVLCHNGPSKSNGDEVFNDMPHDAKIKTLHTDRLGIGAAYSLGIKAATSDFVVLSASDLPFGFSDIESFQSLRVRNINSLIAIGSKLHPESILQGYLPSRILASKFYSFFRQILFKGKMPRDTQGTVIIERKTAIDLASRINRDDYLFNLELVLQALHKNIKVTEVPVVYMGSAATEKSSIKLWKDGPYFIWETFLIWTKFVLKSHNN